MQWTGSKAKHDDASLLAPITLTRATHIQYGAVELNGRLAPITLTRAAHVQYCAVELNRRGKTCLL